VKLSFRDSEIQSDAINNILSNFEESLITWSPKQRPQPRRRQSWTRPQITRTDSSSSGTSTPRGDQDITRIICDFLGLSDEECSTSTSLLSLGLDSIKAVTLSKKLREAGYPISASNIMRTPIIRKLWKLVSSSQSSRGRRIAEDVSTFSVSPTGPLEIKPLHSEDKIQLYFATALQSGMLSQVR
jgi:aryl carrier-like protein